MNNDYEIICINPNLVLKENDLFTTGIVYMPIGLAYFAAKINSCGFKCNVIDAFGENPNQYWKEKDFIFRGLHNSEILKLINNSNDSQKIIFIYASNITYHLSVIDIIKCLRKEYKFSNICILENTQAVTAYSLEIVKNEFFKAGANYVVTGEAEVRSIELINSIIKSKNNEKFNVNGVFNNSVESNNNSIRITKINNLDELPFPAWDLFPVKNYWELKYAHGPLSSNKYLPILTSRGCPYPCKFCVIPKTNDLKWRPRTPKNVVDEIEHWHDNMNIKEFHIEDVDPTVNDKRIREISEEIINRKLKIIWKICSGTKIETIKSESTVELMAKSGCNYISISPESGSDKIMKQINKPFNYEHAAKLLRTMQKVGIFTQACFVLGYPGEDDNDREKTKYLVKILTKIGVSEIAQFIITPVPGSAIQNEFTGYKNLSELNFSPTWRKDYLKLNRYRIKLYIMFMLWKFLYHPLSIIVQPINVIKRCFKTKMEMTLYRYIHTNLMLKGMLGKEYKNNI